jgi:hypothetical protein
MYFQHLANRVHQTDRVRIHFSRSTIYCSPISTRPEKQFFDQPSTYMMKRDRQFYLDCIRERAGLDGGVGDDYYQLLARLTFSQVSYCQTEKVEYGFDQGLHANENTRSY